MLMATKTVGSVPCDKGQRKRKTWSDVDVGVKFVNVKAVTSSVFCMLKQVHSETTTFASILRLRLAEIRQHLQPPDTSQTRVW